MSSFLRSVFKRDKSKKTSASAAIGGNSSTTPATADDPMMKPSKESDYDSSANSQHSEGNHYHDFIDVLLHLFLKSFSHFMYT